MFANTMVKYSKKNRLPVQPNKLKYYRNMSLGLFLCQRDNKTLL